MKQLTDDMCVCLCLSSDKTDYKAASNEDDMKEEDASFKDEDDNDEEDESKPDESNEEQDDDNMEDSTSSPKANSDTVTTEKLKEELKSIVLPPVGVTTNNNKSDAKGKAMPCRFRSAFILFSSTRHKEIRQELAAEGKTERVSVVYMCVKRMREAARNITHHACRRPPSPRKFPKIGATWIRTKRRFGKTGPRLTRSVMSVKWMSTCRASARNKAATWLPYRNVP